MYCANRRKQPQPPKEKADRKERRRGFFAPILLLAALGCFLLFRVGQNVQPTLNALAGYECRSSCLEIINQSVQDVLAREPELCRGLYVYDQDDDGTILAVRADPQAMSRVQLRLTQEVIDRLGARKADWFGSRWGRCWGGRYWRSAGRAFPIAICRTPM